MHHVYGSRYADADDAAAFYWPSFYSIEMKGGVRCDELVSKLRASVNGSAGAGLSEQEVQAWFYFCHEYVHFLQDLRCANLRRDAVCRLRVALGRQDELIDGEDVNPVDTGIKLEATDCKRTSDDAWTVEFKNYESCTFTKVALAECIAMVLEDELRVAREGRRNVAYLPYDMPYLVAELILGDSFPDLKATVLDVCEAALQTECPVSAFVNYLKSVAGSRSSGPVSYDMVLKWCRENDYRQCEEFDDGVFSGLVAELLGRGKMKVLSQWLSEKVDKIAEVTDKNRFGLFRMIYERSICSGKPLADQIAQLVKNCAYPLIADQSNAYCHEKDGNEVGFWLGLATAYELVVNSDVEIPCGMLPFCRQANNPILNRDFATAPKVSAFCTFNPRFVQQDGNVDCPFVYVWKKRLDQNEAGVVAK